jgi:hypothetical protein
MAPASRIYVALEIDSNGDLNVISTANSEFCPFWCDCCRWRNHKTKMYVSRNPRRTNTFTDCRAEPKKQTGRSV